MEDATSEGRTVLFVSHNISAIQKLCSSCLLLDQGMLKKYGITSDVLTAYQEQISLNSTEKVVSTAKISLPLRSITYIKLNNSENRVLNIGEGERNLSIEIEGEIEVDSTIVLEVIFRDNNGQVVAVFLPGHIYEEIKKTPRGRFILKETIELPENINQGSFIVDIAITRPGVAYYMQAMECAKINTKGAATLNGVVFEYSKSGLVALKRFDR